METIGTRLRAERERLRLNQEAFGAKAGVKKNAQINYERGKRSPDTEYLERIAAAGADVGFILTGTRYSHDLEANLRRLDRARDRVLNAVFDRSGLSNADYNSVMEQALNNASDEELAVTVGELSNKLGERPTRYGETMVKLSVYDLRTGAGGGALTDDFPELLDEVTFPESLLRHVWKIRPAHAGIAIAQGPSMEPEIRSGELLIYDRSVDTVRSDGLYIFALGEERFLKDLQRLPGRIKVISRNPRFDPWFIEGDKLAELQVVGRVIVHGRML